MSDAGAAVAVIVPCYRVSDVVAETLESLRAQTVRGFETIVVSSRDAADTAELRQVLTPYENEIRFMQQNGAGLADARNSAILATQAPLVAFLDGDDRWKPNYLEVQLEYLRRHPEIDVVYPNGVIFGATSFSGRKLQDTFTSKGEVTFENILSGQSHISIAVTARRQALLDVGLFDAELRWAEDYDLWLRMTKAGHKIAYHNEPLFEYRVRSGALSADKLNGPKTAIHVLQKLLDRDDLTADERRWVSAAQREYEGIVDFVLGKIALYRENREEALTHLSAASRTMKDNWRLRAAVWGLRIAPPLVYEAVHRRYKSEYQFLH